MRAHQKSLSTSFSSSKSNKSGGLPLNRFPVDLRRKQLWELWGRRQRWGSCCQSSVHMPGSKLHSGPHDGGLLLSKDGHTSHPDGTFQCPLVNMSRPYSEQQGTPSDQPAPLTHSVPGRHQGSGTLTRNLKLNLRPRSSGLGQANACHFPCSFLPLPPSLDRSLSPPGLGRPFS